MHEALLYLLGSRWASLCIHFCLFMKSRKKAQNEWPRYLLSFECRDLMPDLKTCPLLREQECFATTALAEIA